VCLSMARIIPLVIGKDNAVYQKVLRRKFEFWFFAA